MRGRQRRLGRWGSGAVETTFIFIMDGIVGGREERRRLRPSLARADGLKAIVASEKKSVTSTGKVNE